MITYQPVWQTINGLANSKPDNTISQETGKDPNKKHSPRRELITGNTREKSNTISNIICHSQDCDLLLAKSQNRFQSRRIEWEVVGVPCRYLNPYCCCQANPWWPAPCFQFQFWHLLLLLLLRPSGIGTFIGC